MNQSTIENKLDQILAELRYLNIMNKVWLTVNDVAAYIGIKPATIYQYVHQSRIPFKKIPGSSKLIFSKNDIDNWIGNVIPISSIESDIKGQADRIWESIK
jgi:excisionase family DNA binding protein